MMDEVKHYAKYAGLWLTKRGIGSLSVMLATTGLQMNAYSVPLVTMPASLLLTHYLVGDQAEYMRTRMRNAYRNELAASLGKDPKEITTQDLYTVALGDAEEGISGNSVLAEQLGRIDKHRKLSLTSSVLAVGAALLGFIAILGGAGEAVFEPLKELAGNLPFIKNHGVFAAGLVAGGLSFASDYVIHETGLNLLGLKRPSTYERIQDIKRDQRSGKEISQTQVLEVFATHNPALAGEIVRIFGKPYDALAEDARQQAVAAFGASTGLEVLTAKINQGRISPNELAFLSEGQTSGVPERDPHERSHIHLFLPQEKQKEAQPQPQPQPAVLEAPAADAARPSFVERYIASVRRGAPQPAQGFAEILRQEYDAPQSGNYRA